LKSHVNATMRCVQPYFDTSRLKEQWTWPTDRHKQGGAKGRDAARHKED
jgi:hypothetical protein